MCYGDCVKESIARGFSEGCATLRYPFPIQFCGYNQLLSDLGSAEKSMGIKILG